MTAMADGDATEMAAEMVDGDRNGNGRRQRRWRWGIATATATATAMVTAIGNSDGDDDGDRNDNSHGKGDHYKGRVASSCGGNVQCFWRGDTLPPPPFTQRKVHASWG